MCTGKPELTAPGMSSSMAYCPRNILRPLKKGGIIVLRYLRVSGASSDESKVVYYANRPRFITCNKVFNENLSAAFTSPAFKIPLVFNDSIVVAVPASTTAENRYYEAIIDVSDNQPIEESVRELTSYGVSISVYNEHGVKICDNSVTASSTQSSRSTSGLGEMTSVPGEEPGEMASETTNEPGVMI